MWHDLLVTTCTNLFVSTSGAKEAGVNPKVNNMLNAYESAQYPLFLISDAGIRSKYSPLLSSLSVCVSV